MSLIVPATKTVEPPETSLVSCPTLSYLTSYLFLELSERGWVLWDTLVRVGLDLLGGEHVVVEQELPHELVAVVHPQVGVVVEGVAVLCGLVHDGVHPLHQLVPHVRQVVHLLQVRLATTQSTGWVIILVRAMLVLGVTP